MTAPDRAWVLGLLEGTTSGPWRAARDVVTSDADGCHVHAMHHVPEYRELVGPCGPRWRADARLIAAAPDLAAALLAALDRVAEVEAERDALARIVEAADPCVEALRDIAADAHAAWLDVYDAATLASVTCEVGDE